MMPKMSVNPLASKNNSRPYWTPFRSLNQVKHRGVGSSRSNRSSGSNRLRRSPPKLERLEPLEHLEQFTSYNPVPDRRALCVPLP